ncbi:MAG: fasciclin domain-containing protein [Flavobacteriales bacterium]|nr:fasciclin domain-containing protein [Flavobacteriales bacterium]
MKNKLTSILSVIALLGFASCGSTDQNSQAASQGSEASVAERNTPMGQASVVDDVSDPNILQVAIGSADHSTLVAAVQAAGIEHILVNAGPLTVFAPVNAAFDALPEGTVESLLKPENKGQLTTILSNHAAAGTFNLKQLRKEAKKGRQVYTAALFYLDVTVEGDDVFVGGAKVLGEVSTSNGYVVVVDNLILPPSE